MKNLQLSPMGWACTIEECPPGFFVADDQLCFKSEYRNDGVIEAFNDSGEAYHGKGSVQPVDYEWIAE